MKTLSCLLFLTLLLSSCFHSIHVVDDQNAMKASLLAVDKGMSMDSVALLLGEPQDVQYTGDKEMWQYCISGPTNEFYVVTFMGQGVSRIGSYSKYGGHHYDNCLKCKNCFEDMNSKKIKTQDFPSQVAEYNKQSSESSRLQGDTSDESVNYRKEKDGSWEKVDAKKESNEEWKKHKGPWAHEENRPDKELLTEMDATGVVTIASFGAGSSAPIFVRESLTRAIVDKIHAAPAHSYQLVGHTNDQGADEANQQLSVLRAEATLEKLVLDHGLRPDLISSSGLGEQEPLADNATREGRLINSRVEIRKLK